MFQRYVYKRLINDTILKNRRSIHMMPTLPNNETLIANGIPNIYSGKGFSVAWEDRQRYLIEKLNMVTNGTTFESMYPFHIMLQAKNRKDQAHIFNLASSVHNNHLFIENILPNGAEDAVGPSKLFLNKVEKSFNKSWEEIKNEIIEVDSRKIVGQGYIFLIENSDKKFQLLNIQNNGTPYYFPMNQSHDLNHVLQQDEIELYHELKEIVKDPKVKIKDYSIPIICISLWDHSYLKDYGVDGREEYLKNVLNNLNWSVINSRLFN
ncbi:hypothetical protein TBLA_0G01990 [Henningerozyma blattae CBS 6284]|uniref:Manganese/iron superoxide dismutase C-terminal domain-containing protein n=1 Tax=Henningerozyma blattae (strain ATCC 34711 / CBS 6284 / DSM 70876 / NBRC 10599 / NRRL Y-10934 / UCD 77-7) TaxID=1071380 RepID=I2H6Y9_HENB6|nr:hypothetical protein TBLA_0G01990 [Tetrapisispora blattae CBS 6284]CCH62141.1 hypothetical protein TBLA_0G01990 [Tetrapisispora blattae CBS 6284]